MRKTFKYAWLMAIAITGVGFVSCSSDDDVVDNPNYNPETREVTANFVFNVATQQGTRMAVETVQAADAPVFRGIEGAQLYSHILPEDGKILATAATANKKYDLGRAVAQGATYIDVANNKSNRIFELALPSNTNTLTFYGKAMQGTPRTGITAADEFGSVVFEPKENAADTHFDLVSRLNGSSTTYRLTEKLMGNILTRIIMNGFNGHNGTYNSNASSVVVSFPGEDDFSGELNWYDYYKRQLNGEYLYPLEEILADAYKALVVINVNEVRAGSGASVARMIGDVWATIKKVEEASPTSMAEEKARAMAGRITTRLGNYFKEAGVNCKWRPITDVKSNYSSHATDDTENYADVQTDLNEFPTSFHLPMGAAQLTLVGTLAASDDWKDNKFSYVTDLPLSGMGGGTTSVENYTYAPELLYFGNSPIRVSDKEHTATGTDAYPNGVANWDNDASWSEDWKANKHVVSTTRSVAMKNDINYGTALLKTTVRYGAGTLNDNNSEINTGEDPQKFIVSDDGGKFILTGVVVGGQNGRMGWNYLRKETTGDYSRFDHMIYDKALADDAGTLKKYTGTAETDKSTPNYTLVFDNYDSSLGIDNQSAVYIALEFVNNTGKDFWGKHNLVRNGGTFYIIGKLDPTDKSLTFNSGHHALPPYDSEGATIKAKRVFIQDYMTTADFVIGANSLKQAYVTVPDLRSSQISLGLSVDLSWQAGISFENVVLGE